MPNQSLDRVAISESRLSGSTSVGVGVAAIARYTARSRRPSSSEHLGEGRPGRTRLEPPGESLGGRFSNGPVDRQLAHSLTWRPSRDVPDGAGGRARGQGASRWRFADRAGRGSRTRSGSCRIENESGGSMASDSPSNTTSTAFLDES
jgi:hypothetical protein